MRLRFRSLIPLVVAPVIALLTATCSDTPTPGGPTTLIPHGTVAFNAVFAPSARHASALYDVAGLEIDRARVVVVRPAADTLKDTTIVFQSGDPDKVLPLRLSATPGEQLTAGLQFKAGDVVLYSGTATVTVTAVNAPPSTEPPPAITVVPVGPGAAAVSVNITPASGTYPTNAPVVLTGHALLADNSEIPDALFGWDVSDPTVAAVNGSGVVQPTTKGGTVVVTASTLNDVSGTATLTFVPPPSQIVTVSGGGQTGAVASTLAQPFVVQVQAADGSGIAGQPVLFSSSGQTGASVGTASTTTDASGRAQTTLTLGQTAGSYGFAATSGTLTTTVTATGTAGAASAITVVSGNGQHDVVQKTLTNPLVVKVADQYGNANAGVTVTWATNGTGAPSATSTTTGADGQTSVTYTLGAQPGTETITASAAGVKTPVTFAETADQSQGTTVTWTGAVSTDWSVAGNWNGGVPNATSKVVVPSGTSNQPALTANATVTDITVANGATLTLGTFVLTASGNVDGGTGPGVTGSSGAVLMTGTAPTLRGFVANVLINGNVTVPAATTISSALAINSTGSMVFGASAPLTVGTLAVIGHMTVANGNTVNATTLTVSGASGLLTQTGGAITVTGDAVFQGANAEGQITAGTLTIGGGLTQASSSSGVGFAASAGHRTIFTGSGARRIAFDNPSASFSHFGDLELDGTGTTTLGSGVIVVGQLISTAGATPVSSAGVVLSVGGLDVDGMTFDNTVLTAGGTLTRFDNVTFQNYAAGRIPLTINHPGAATPFTMNNTKFLVTPTTGGAYLEADDATPTDQNVLTIRLLGSTPSDGSANTITTGGAVVTWPTVTPGTNKWIGTGSTGNWSDPTKWSLSRVPVTGDSVVIDAAGNYSVTLDTTFTASTITIGGSGSQAALDLIGRTLTVNKQIYIQSGATLYVGGGTLTGTGSVSNQGSLTVSVGTISIPVANQGTINASGTISMGGALTTTAASKLSVMADAINRSTLLTMANGFTNNGTIEMNSTGGAYSGTLTIANGTLTNAVGATISALPGTGGTRTIDGSLDNQGTLASSGIFGLAPMLGSVTNSGTFTVTGGVNVQIGATGSTRSFTNSGTISVAVNSGIAVPGGQYISQPTATLTGAGRGIFTNATVTLDGTVTPGGLDFTGGTVAFKSNPAVTGTGMIFTNTSVSGAGVLTNAAGQTMTFSSSGIGSVTIGTAGLVNRGTLTITGGVTINAPLTTASTSTINISQTSTNNTIATIANGFTNLGALNFSTQASNRSANLTLSAGTLVNAPGGTIAALAGAGSNALIALVNNQGTINVASAFQFGNGAGAETNSGTINVTGGNLAMGLNTGSFTNSGTFTIASGYKVSLNGGTITHQANATLNGGGELDLTATTMAFNGPFTLSALSITNSTTVSFAANVNVSTANTALTLGGLATINGPGTITNAAGKVLVFNQYVTMNAPFVNLGTVNVIGTNNAINGTYTDAAGAALSIYSNGQTSNSSLTFASGFTNNGTIDLTSTVDAYPTSLTVTTGTLTNSASGTIKASAGTGGARTLAAPFSNAGVITATGPLFVNYTDSSSNNSGTIDATAGDVTVTQTVASGTPTFFNDGTITVGTGHTFTVTGGAFNNGNTRSRTGTMVGAGSAVINNATANFVIAPTLGAASFNTSTLNTNVAFSSTTTTLSFDNTTVGGQGSITNVAGKTITLANGSVINVPFTNQGTFNAINNNNTLGVSYTDDPKAVLNIYADGKNGSAANLTLPNSISNNGTINLTSQGGAFSSGLNIAGGNSQLLNYGTINSQAGSGGARAIVLPTGATMTNYGVIDVHPGAVGQLSITGNVMFLNAGTFRVEVASLSSFDLVAINGRLGTDGGHIVVTPLDNYVPSSKDMFRVITYSNGQSSPFLTVDSAGWSGSGSPAAYTLTKN